MIRRAAITITALCGLAGLAMAHGNRPTVLDVVGLPAPGDDRPRPIYMVMSIQITKHSWWNAGGNIVGSH